MSRTAKCSVMGCPGVVTFDSNGRGAVKGECPCCEKRDAWKAKHLPETTRFTCEVCTGQFTARSKGPTLRYCQACRKLVTKKLNREGKERHAQKVRPLRSA